MPEITEGFDVLDPLDPADVARGLDKQAASHEQQATDAQQALRGRRAAYQRLFNATGAENAKKAVLKDLERFCRGNDTAWADDARLHALLTGRQEVYRRIMDHLEMTFDDQWEKYNRTPVT